MIFLLFATGWLVLLLAVVFGADWARIDGTSTDLSAMLIGIVVLLCIVLHKLERLEDRR